MTIDSFAREVYEFFYYKIYNQHAAGERTEATDLLYGECVSKLEKHYGNSVGPDFIWFYVMYQFARFSGVNFKPRFASRLSPVNVFGKTAVVKFQQRRKELDDLTKQSSFIIQYGITKREFTLLTSIPFNPQLKKDSNSKISKSIKSYRNVVKAAVVNTEYGFEACIDLTDLYNDEDLSCQKCKRAEECKVLLEKMYPHLYKLKGYGI